MSIVSTFVKLTKRLSGAQTGVSTEVGTSRELNRDRKD
jgi:hypothetical protein